MMTKQIAAACALAMMSTWLLAEPISSSDREVLRSLHDQYTGTPYRLAWSEYRRIPPELYDEFEQAGLGDATMDPITDQPLHLLYDKMYLTNGAGSARLQSRNLTLAGPEDQLSEWVIFRDRLEATIPAGPLRRAELFQYEEPTTPEERRDYWAEGQATYEYMAPLGVFHEIIGLNASRLLEADDVTVTQTPDGKREFRSEFWRVALVLDDKGRAYATENGDPGDPTRKSIAQARFEVLEFADDTSPNAQPVVVRKEIRWTGDSPEWALNLIAVYQPIERGFEVSSAAFEWQTFAETAMDAMTGAVIDPSGTQVGTSEPTIFTVEQVEEMPAPAALAKAAERVQKKQLSRGNSATLRTILIILGGLLTVGAGGAILRRQLAG